MINAVPSTHGIGGLFGSCAMVSSTSVCIAGLVCDDVVDVVSLTADILTLSIAEYARLLAGLTLLTHTSFSLSHPSSPSPPPHRY